MSIGRSRRRVPVPSSYASGTARPQVVARTGFEWNYTTVLNLIALLAFAAIYWLYRTRGDARRRPARYAKDPICGMQVEKD